LDNSGLSIAGVIEYFSRGKYLLKCPLTWCWDTSPIFWPT